MFKPSLEHNSNYLVQRHSCFITHESCETKLVYQWKIKLTFATFFHIEMLTLFVLRVHYKELIYFNDVKSYFKERRMKDFSN